MAILAYSLEVIQSVQAEAIIVQAGRERFATLSSQIHNAQYFPCSNGKKNPYDFLNKFLGCFTDGVKKETLK